MRTLKITFILLLVTVTTSLFAGTLTFSNQTQQGVVGTVTVDFTDGSQKQYSIGGPGTYQYDIAQRQVKTITIGGVPCSVGQTVTVTLSSGGTANHSVQDEARSFNSIIR